MKKIVSIALLPVLTISLNTNAQDEIIIEQPVVSEVDLFLESADNSSEDVSFEYIDQLQPLTKVEDAVILPLKKKKRFDSSEKLRPKRFRAALRKNSIIENIESGKAFKNFEMIYVVAQEIHTEGKHAYIFNKEGKAIFTTLTKNLKSIEQELTLHPKIDATKTYVKKENYRATNKSLKLEHNLIFSNESYDITGLTNTLKRNETSASATSGEYRIFHRSFLPIHIGLLAQLQQGSFEQIEGQSQVPNWSAFYIGTALRYNAYSSKKYSFNILGAFKRSLFYQLETEVGGLEFSNTVWQLEVQGVYKTKYGNFSASLARITQAQSFKPTLGDDEVNATVALNNEKQELTGTSLAIGYQYEFSL